MTMLSAYDTWQAEPVVALSTTRAKVLATDTSCRALMLTLDPAATTVCMIGDVTVTNAAAGNVHTYLSAGGSVTIPVKDTTGIYAVMASSTANLAVSLLK